jgi:hypothetical protein
MEDHSVVHTLINIILKESFRQTNLRQIGKVPRFFDTSKSISIEGTDLQCWPGFRASAFNYEMGMAVVIDNVNKFMSTTSCLERINQIFQDQDLRGEPEEMVRREFKGSSVIANWGLKKAYIVSDILFKETPFTKSFEDSEGNSTTVANYFLKTYNMKISQGDQPLLVCKIGGKECHLPTEFCTMDGVPDAIRNDPFKMRNSLCTEESEGLGNLN